MVLFFNKSKPGTTLNVASLHEACRIGNLRAVQMKISNGATWTADDNGFYPIHHLTLADKDMHTKRAILNTLKQLSNFNIDQKTIPKPGMAPSTALQMSAVNGARWAIDDIELLIEFGADPLTEDREHNTPFHLAVIEDKWSNAICFAEKVNNGSDKKNGAKKTPIDLIFDKAEASETRHDFDIGAAAGLLQLAYKFKG